MNFLNKLFEIMIYALLFWFFGYLIFAGLADWKFGWKSQDNQTTTQAIAILTEYPEGLKKGFQFWCSNKSEIIFIPGLSSEKTLDSLLNSAEILTYSCPRPAKLESTIYLRYGEKNTKELAKWISQNSITSLRLVASAYQMPRNLLELKQLLPNVTIIPSTYPIFLPFRIGYLYVGWVHSVFSEYNRFLLRFIQIHILFKVLGDN